MPKVLNYQTVSVNPSVDVELTMTRFYHDEASLGVPVFMLHSVMHNGDIFFTDEGKGLACYLARNGFDVYVADLRGKGRNKKALDLVDDYGDHEVINNDIPSLIEKIIEIRGNEPQFWIGHGWGSVQLCGYYARFAHRLCEVKGLVHFGAARKSAQNNQRKRFLHNPVWGKVLNLYAKRTGYVPTCALGLGTDNESPMAYSDYLTGSISESWVDTSDGYHYSEAFDRCVFPSSYYIAVETERLYGDVEDTRAFIRELGPHDARLIVLSRKGGNLHNYNHTEIVDHVDAEKDHFPEMLRWLSDI